MAWTTPKTWATNDPMDASTLNTHVRDNLNALKAPPTASYKLNESANYSTTSTSFADIDAANLALTITTTGGDVLVVFAGSFSNGGGAAYVYVDFAVDGTRQGLDDGVLCLYSPSASSMLNGSFAWLVTGLAAGSHTFKLQWKSSGGTITLYAGAGTASVDLHPKFWVREV